MATWLKQSIAVEIKLGPFVDNADGFTPETGLTIAQADVRLAKNEGDWAQKSETTTLVHEENGWYRCLLNTTDTGTLGILVVAVNETGALPVWREFIVLPANIYDSWVLGTDLQDVSTTQFNGSAVTQAGGRPEVNTTHAAGTAWASGAITAAVIATDAIDSDAIAASAVTEINTGMATSAALATVDTNVSTVLTRIGTPTNLGGGATLSFNLSDIEAQTDDIGAAGAGLTALVDAVWDEATSGHVTAGTVGQKINNIYTVVDTEVATLQTDVTAIKAKTDNLPTTPASTSDIPTAATIADAVWEEPLTSHEAVSDSAAEHLNGVTANVFTMLFSGSPVSSASIDAIVDEVWDEPTSGHTTSGTFGEQAKTDVDAIKAKTDSLTFTVAGQIDSNLESVNGTTVTGSGTGGDPWGP